MSYPRVIPRDLFNEAKLLKCLGQLALLILDGVGVPRGLSLKHDEEAETGFQIEQDDSDGALYCENIACYYGGRFIGLRAPYNSKDAYPLQFILQDQEGAVFDDRGKLSAEFCALLSSLDIAR